MTDRANPSFRQALVAWVEQDQSLSHGHLAPSWGQGRATQGGLVGAIAMRHMLRRVPAERAPRSFTATFVGPLVAGEASCRTEVLREGKSATLVEARIVQGSELCCVAQGVFAGPRESIVEVVHPPARPIEAPDRYEPMPYLEGMMPAFLQHLRLRWAYGNVPFSGMPVVPIGGYCEAIGDEQPDACSVVMLLDAWPTPGYTPMKTPAGASTVSSSVDFLVDMTARTYRAPFRFEGAAASAGAGHLFGDAWLWDADGVPIARARQLVALFG